MMYHAVILAGGIGRRMGTDIPKQYLPVKGVPIFVYSARKFAGDSRISTLVIVVSEEWKGFVADALAAEGIRQEVLFAPAGRSRQHSVWNGLTALQGRAGEDDLVFVHDAVRPLFPLSNIADGIEACKVADMALPVIAVKDATYQSADGENLTAILPRSELFSGQSPECLRYGPFVRAHAQFADEEIARIRGCSELAFRAGLKVRMIPGTEQNFKITTIEDLQALTLIL